MKIKDYKIEVNTKITIDKLDVTFSESLVLSSECTNDFIAEQKQKMLNSNLKMIKKTMEELSE